MRLFDDYPWERHRNYDTHVDKTTVREICELYESGVSVDDIAQEYGLPERRVHLLVCGHDVENPWRTDEHG